MRSRMLWLAALIAGVLSTLFVAMSSMSVSVGREQLAVDQEVASFEPGRYIVHVKRPMPVPHGMRVEPRGTFGAKFRHDGKGKGEDEACDGEIVQLLKDDGSLVYECETCKKRWISKSFASPTE